MKTRLNEQEAKLVTDAILAKAVEFPDKGQKEVFGLALHAVGMQDKMKVSPSNASIWTRKANGLTSGKKTNGVVQELPSQIILKAERTIANALLELEHQRDVKMNEVKDLDNMISRYKHFRKA